MTADELRAVQTPLKNRYREQPASAQLTLRIEGTAEPASFAFRVDSPRGPIRAGLHPAAGGDGTLACSGDMLLEALVGCAGVTLQAVATALGVPLRCATIRAEGDLDFRGTLGVAKDCPVGFSAIRLTYDLDTDAPRDQIDKLIQLTERYCVIYQTLTHPPAMSHTMKGA
jgi:uncharacterized OsmC-like protein